MTQTETLLLALKAMKVNNSAWKHLADSGDAGYWEAEEQECYQLNEQAITAVEAALEAKDEPVGYFSVNDYGNWEENESNNGIPLYTTPPQRKPLTDEEIGDEFVRFQVGGMFTPFLYAVRAIEAAHGIKGKA